MKKIRKSMYGWQPDLPDQRDLQYAASKKTLRKIPEKIDLREFCPPIYSQGSLGSCTANAVAAAYQFEKMKQDKGKGFVPSRLFIYYNERIIVGNVNVDSGAQIRDGIKTVHKQGVCAETVWPYKINQFAVKPPVKAYKEALGNQVLKYQRVKRSLNEMKACLVEGFPFVFGFTVYESFEGAVVAKTGKLNMPSKKEKAKGGHAVMAVGYDDAQKRFIIRNSWGEQWGMKGYFTMPYDYMLEENLSDDFWTIRLVEE